MEIGVNETKAADPKTGRPRYCELKKKGQQMLAL
jgi:hypothetical protein